MGCAHSSREAEAATGPSNFQHAARVTPHDRLHTDTASSTQTSKDVSVTSHVEVKPTRNPSVAPAAVAENPLRVPPDTEGQPLASPEASPHGSPPASPSGGQHLAETDSLASLLAEVRPRESGNDPSLDAMTSASSSPAQEPFPDVVPLGWEIGPDGDDTPVPSPRIRADSVASSHLSAHSGQRDTHLPQYD